jgi:hypothetical protein
MAARNTIRKIGKAVVTFDENGEPQSADDNARGDSIRSQPRARGPPLVDSLLTVGEAAAILRCSVSSLNKWRLNGRGPAFLYCGRRVRYTRAALAAFIAASTRQSTSDPGPGGCAASSVA